MALNTVEEQTKNQPAEELGKMEEEYNNPDENHGTVSRTWQRVMDTCKDETPHARLDFLVPDVTLECYETWSQEQQPFATGLEFEKDSPAAKKPQQQQQGKKATTPAANSTLSKVIDNKLEVFCDQDCLTKARPPDRFQKLYRKLVQQVQRLQLVNNRALLLKKVFQLLNKWIKCLLKWTFFLVLLFLFHSAKADCDYGKDSRCPSSSFKKIKAASGDDVLVGTLPKHDDPFKLEMTITESGVSGMEVSKCCVIPWGNILCTHCNETAHILRLEKNGTRSNIKLSNVRKWLTFHLEIAGPEFFHSYDGIVLVPGLSTSGKGFVRIPIPLLVLLVPCSLVGVCYVFWISMKFIKKKIDKHYHSVPARSPLPSPTQLPEPGRDQVTIDVERDPNNGNFEMLDL